MSGQHNDDNSKQNNNDQKLMNAQPQSFKQLNDDDDDERRSKMKRIRAKRGNIRLDESGTRIFVDASSQTIGSAYSADSLEEELELLRGKLATATAALRDQQASRARELAAGVAEVERRLTAAHADALACLRQDHATDVAYETQRVHLHHQAAAMAVAASHAEAADCEARDSELRVAEMRISISSALEGECARLRNELANANAVVATQRNELDACTTSVSIVKAAVDAREESDARLAAATTALQATECERALTAETADALQCRALALREAGRALVADNAQKEDAFTDAMAAAGDAADERLRAMQRRVIVGGAANIVFTCCF
jgi:hypothetical protein